MDDEAVFHWPMLLLPLAVLCYFALLRWLDRRWAMRSPLTDEERLALLARRQAVSEHALFHAAAENWRIVPDRVEEDFKAYLNAGGLPHYVRDYLRRHFIDPRP